MAPESAKQGGWGRRSPRKKKQVKKTLNESPAVYRRMDFKILEERLYRNVREIGIRPLNRIININKPHIQIKLIRQIITQCLHTIAFCRMMPCPEKMRSGFTGKMHRRLINFAGQKRIHSGINGFLQPAAPHDRPRIQRMDCRMSGA